MTIDIDRVKIARYGININDIQNVIKVAVGGKTATQVYEDNKIFNVIIRFPEHKRDSLETIGNLLISSPAGYKVPLSELASIQDIEGPLQISREDGQRRIGLEMNISGRDIGSFVSEAKEKIKNSVKFPTGYYLSWGGQFENQQNAMDHSASGSWINYGPFIYDLWFNKISFIDIFKPVVCYGRRNIRALFFQFLFISARVSRLYCFIRSYGVER